jgi:hypothetical protein
MEYIIFKSEQPNNLNVNNTTIKLNNYNTSAFVSVGVFAL